MNTYKYNCEIQRHKHLVLWTRGALKASLSNITWLKLERVIYIITKIKNLRDEENQQFYEAGLRKKSVNFQVNFKKN